jgi:anti-sigma regulatory factor (Ser/Thr protein kinase)
MSHPRAWVAEIEVEIVVSELVANAVLNGSEPIVLSLDERDGLIRISVSDGNPELPQENEDDDRMTFGLKIVRALAHRFGASRRGVDGKTTWAEF